MYSMYDTQVPIICIANDRQAQKLKPLIATTFNLPFQRFVQYITSRLMFLHSPRPQAAMVRSRILTIAFKYVFLPLTVFDR